MALLISDLKDRFELRYTITEYTANQFLLWLSDALHWYSRFNPLITETTMNSVAQQAEYDLPENCVLVIEVLCQPISWTGNLSLATGLNRRSGRGKEYPSETTIRDVENRSGVWNAWELWHQEGTKLVFSDKFASSGETFRLRYTTEHVIAESNLTIDTVPSYDAELLVEMVLAEVLEARMSEASVTEDWTEGLQKEISSHIPQNAQAVINALRRKVMDKYSAVGAVIG